MDPEIKAPAAEGGRGSGGHIAGGDTSEGSTALPSLERPARASRRADLQPAPPEFETQERGPSRQPEPLLPCVLQQKSPVGKGDLMGHPILRY
jgi:hypothetical protein